MSERVVALVVVAVCVAGVGVGVGMEGGRAPESAEESWCVWVCFSSHLRDTHTHTDMHTQHQVKQRPCGAP